MATGSSVATAASTTSAPPSISVVWAASPSTVPSSAWPSAELPGDDLRAMLDRPSPVVVRLVPLDCVSHALHERHAGLPPQLLADAGRVDRIAAIMARSIGDELDAIVR